MAKKPIGSPTSWSFEVNKDELVQLQVQTERLEHASRRAGFYLKLLVPVLLVAFLIGMAWSASGSHQIVIDDFDVAPSVQQGLTGEAVARRIRNHLTFMRLATGSQPETEDELEPDWLEDSQIEIPQTGIRLGALHDELRRALGDDTHIRGEVYRDGEVLSLAVRTDETSRNFTGPSLNELIRRAAEWVYMQTDRYHYAIYLSRSGGRLDDSKRQLVMLATEGPDTNARAVALNGLAANLIDFEGECSAAIPVLAEAKRLNPNLSNIYGNLSNAQFCLGHDQAAADATAHAMRILQSDPGELDSEQVNQLLLEDRDNLAGSRGDHRGRLAFYDAMETAGLGDQSRRRALAFAEIGEAHTSMMWLTRWHAVRQWDPGFVRFGHAFWNVRFTQAWSLGNWSEAAGFIQRANAQLTNNSGPYARAQLATQSLPLEAMALARAGDIQRAVQIAERLPGDCYLCARSRALVAELRGDRNDANRWYRRAIRLGPRLPFAYAEFGEVQLRRGEAFLAHGYFEHALRHGPEFADAYKGRGDAFYALGRFDAAARSYEAAARRAPRWGELHLRWAWTLARLRQVGEARAITCAADGMDLGRTDRALLARWRERGRLTC